MVTGMDVRFGPFWLDSDSRRLREEGVERPLSAKAFDLLCLLVSCRPRVVPKSEIHERLWPSTFVSDGTLTSVVAELRGALRQKGRRGGWVRTVHGKGYAFDGLVTDDITSPAHPARCWIVWEWGQVALSDGGHLLGRDRDAAVWLDSPGVSRHHARIRVAGAEATIEDLGSKNGTYVGGMLLTTPLPLADGDQIRLGSVEVRFRLREKSGSTETERPH
jgi:DNA-binding winged helix-turn-helix (wHTH) protein